MLLRRLNIMRQMSMERLKMRYLRGSRKVKGEVLDELCQTDGYHRKHAIRLLTKQPIGWRDKPAGRKKKYDPKVLLAPIKQIRLATDQMRGKRLKAALPLWLPLYESSFEALSSGIAFNFLRKIRYS